MTPLSAVVTVPWCLHEVPVLLLFLVLSKWSNSPFFIDFLCNKIIVCNGWKKWYFGFLSRILIFFRFFRKLTCFYDKDGSIDAGPIVWSFFLRSLWPKYPCFSKNAWFFRKNDLFNFEGSRIFFSIFENANRFKMFENLGVEPKKKFWRSLEKEKKSKYVFFGVSVRPYVRPSALEIYLSGQFFFEYTIRIVSRIEQKWRGGFLIFFFVDEKFQNWWVFT